MSCQFIPPYLLQQIVDNASEDDVSSRLSRSTLQVDQRLRTGRRVAERRPLTTAAAPTNARRTIHDTHNTEELPGELVRDGDQPSGDQAVDEAWDSSAAIWDLFADVFSRESVDGEGTPIVVTVHFGTNYDNAF